MTDWITSPSSAVMLGGNMSALIEEGNMSALIEKVGV